jgi:penicillin-binding protein 1A
VTLWELNGVFASLARSGVRLKPVFVRKVIDRDGKVLEDGSHPADPALRLGDRIRRGVVFSAKGETRVMDEDSAYILNSLLKEVCTSGTAGAAARLGQPVAGKTGTTNDSFDAWFMGFSRHLATGVWVGFDVYDRPLGRWETGGKAALPIWMSYMQKYLEGRRENWFEPPQGIVILRVNPDTGKPLSEGAEGGISEPFKKNYLPDETAPGAPPPTVDFMRIDAQ